MHSSLLPLLASPEDGGTLTLTIDEQEGDEILTGTLTDAHGRSFPIVDGIPCLLPSNLLEAQKSEISARDAQVEDYDRMAFLNLLSRVEIPLTVRALGPRPDDRLLEAGCGTGRMTQTFAGMVRELIAIDFSLESLRVNSGKLKKQGIKNVHLVQADLCHLPFVSAHFNRIVSCQVLEHIPDDASRRAAICELARVGKPHAALALSAYKHSLFTRLFGQKEGAHEGGIPFFRFTPDELRDVLSAGFEVKSITGALVYVHLARGIKKT